MEVCAGGWEAREVGQPCTEGEGRNEGGEERQGTGGGGKERKEIRKQPGRRGGKEGRRGRQEENTLKCVYSDTKKWIRTNLQ